LAFSWERALSVLSEKPKKTRALALFDAFLEFSFIRRTIAELEFFRVKEWVYSTEKEVFMG
jgi:hypothetical protein